MHRSLFFSLVLGLLLPTALPADDVNPPAGFVSLFNGKDLTGWKATGKANVWGAEKGVIYVSGGGGGYLMTEKEYDNFELRVDFKMSKASNSGVAIRSPLQGNPSSSGMEIQLIDDRGWPSKLQPYQHTGSIYAIVPASKIATKAHDEWNTIRIVAKDSKVQIEVNGEKVVDADLNEHVKKHPQLARKTGHIGFQSYNVRVEFKNIYLKPL